MIENCTNMQSIVRGLKDMVTRAVRQSFPVQDEAVVTPGTVQQKADFVSPSAEAKALLSSIYSLHFQ